MKTSFLIFIVLFLISCGSNAYKNSDLISSEKIEPVSKESQKDFSAEETATNRSAVQNSDELKNEQIAITERKLIKQGSLSFETDSVDKTKRYIADKVKFYEGYISKEYSYDFTEQKQYELEIRIPSQKFDYFLESLNGVMVSLDHKDIQVKDITEEYVDIEARIKSKKDLMNRYIELLKQAKTVAEMLDIEREIGNLQADIESFEGRLNYLQNQTSLSTITLTFYEHRSKDFGFWSKIGKSLSSGWNGLLWFFVGVMYLWPVWLFLFVGLWILLRYLKRKKKA